MRLGSPDGTETVSISEIQPVARVLPFSGGVAMLSLRHSARKGSFRPVVERLEDRMVPSGNTIISDPTPNVTTPSFLARSEERRVGKECRL